MFSKIYTLEYSRDQFIKSIAYALLFIILLLTVRSVEGFYELDLSFLGISPRELESVFGIFTAPLIHGNFYHLFTNALPLFVLISTIIFFFDKKGLESLIWIYIASGICVWISGREAYHIGSSGLVYGFTSFLFVYGFLRPNALACFIAILTVLNQEEMTAGLIPTDGSLSWEYHLFGLMVGIFVAVYSHLTDKRKETKSQPSTPQL